jgi:hypothetical protein
VICSAGAIGLPISTLGQMHVVDRDVWNYAYGEGLIQSIPATGTPATSTQTFGYLQAYENYDVKGVYESTQIRVQESVVATNGGYPQGDRWLSCPLDRQSFKVNPNQASVSATLDAGSASCYTYGYLCDGSTCLPWMYSGQIGVRGDWHDSRFTTKGTQSYQTADNLLGTSGKSTCQYAYGAESKGGFSIGPNTYVFGSPNTTGHFQSQSCSSNAK